MHYLLQTSKARRKFLSVSDNHQREATPWSALTCQRFGRLRPVATRVWLSLFKHRRLAASDQSADRSAHSKKLPLLLVQSFLKRVARLLVARRYSCSVGLAAY